MNSLNWLPKSIIVIIILLLEISSTKPRIAVLNPLTVHLKDLFSCGKSKLEQSKAKEVGQLSP